jgi:23S rRNA-/tRNA-specific pseudouridylate synthase
VPEVEKEEILYEDEEKIIIKKAKILLLGYFL